MNARLESDTSLLSGDGPGSAETTAIDTIETLLAYLICAEEVRDHVNVEGRAAGGRYEKVDAGLVLKFDPLSPTLSYTTQDSPERCYTTSPEYLVAPVQETVGEGVEFAILGDDHVVWCGFRRLRKLPRNVWVGRRGCSLYEMHYRRIYSNGRSFYAQRVAAVARDGTSVPVVLEGSKCSKSRDDTNNLVLAASIVEDAHRSDALTATLTDSSSVVVPVPLGEHRDLFALRDAPLSKSGRRKAILHWVSKHARRVGNSITDVKAHWRGTRQIEIDGLRVSLTTNGPT